MVILNNVKIGNWFFKNRSFIPLFIYAFSTIYLLLENSLNRDIPLQKEILFLFISLLGLFIRILVVGYVPKKTSGRNTRRQIANSLNTKGLYSLVRHPLYIGNFFIWLGITLFINDNIIIINTLLFYLIYYWFIIQAEEDFLYNKFGNIFLHWKKKTPLCIPLKIKYNKNELGFSLKKVLIREYSGFYAIFISFAYFDFLIEYIKGSKIEIGFWTYALIISSTITIALKILKNNTNLLDTNRI